MKLQKEKWDCLMMNEIENSMKPDYTFKNVKELLLSISNLIIDENFINSFAIIRDDDEIPPTNATFYVVTNHIPAYIFQLFPVKIYSEENSGLYKSKMVSHFGTRQPEKLIRNDEKLKGWINIYKFYDKLYNLFNDKLIFLENIKYLENIEDPQASYAILSSRGQNNI